MNLTLQGRKGNKVVYTLDGTNFKVPFPQRAFGGADPFPTINGDTVFPTKAAAPALTKEQRAAARAAETPEQKVEKARKVAERAAKKLAKLEANLAVTA